MPVYNEKNTIQEILRQVRSVEIPKEIIMVDDGSTDGTTEILSGMAKDDAVKILYHDRNRGKGAAIRTGLPHATGELIIIQDADLEYDPRDYPALIQPILEGRAQVVYGSRFLGPHKAMLFWHSVANNVLTLITNILYDTTLTDMETCYKLFESEILRGIPINARGFEFEPEITAKVLRRGYRIYEVPISYTGREYDEGKKIKFRDAVTALFSLIRYRFSD
jgi:glycosyltransferase involved in cell wall biosynthesis